MTGPPIEVVGRGPEINRIVRWFRADGPPTLVIGGPAGVGKSTVLAAAVAAIRGSGVRVLASSPTEAESRLSYSGLADLLGDEMALAGPSLPRPQGRALAVAMRLEDPGDRAPDETAVARGLLQALRVIARSGSCLVSIDDLRWLDGPSLAAVIYAARRLGPGDRIRILTTQRSGAPEPAGLDDPDAVARVFLGPLSVGGIHRVLRLHTGTSLSRPRLLEVHAGSLGNPLHALELARARESGATPEDGTLARLFQARIGALPPGTQQALLVVAASADRSLDRLARAWAGDVAGAIGPAIAAGLVTIERDQVRPLHPLVTHLAYESADGPARRDAHRQLALTASGDEERALHLGRSVAGPDAATADQVDAAAREARARGVRALAATLYESAARLTPGAAVEDRARRLLAAASAWFDSGDTVRVEAILEPLIAELPIGDQRCEARWRLGKALDEAGRWREAVALWTEALSESDDLALRSQVQCSLAITALYTDSIERALDLATDGLGEAERSADPRAIGRALAVQAFLLALSADARFRVLMDRALAIEASVDEPLGEWSPSAIAAECARHIGDTDAALRHYQSVLDRATGAGDANIEQWAAFGLAWTQIVAGDLASASELADLVLDIADQTRVMWIPARSLRALIDAWLGDLANARTLVQEAIRLATEADETTHQFTAVAVLGTIEALAGDAREAARVFGRARQLAGSLGLAHASALRTYLFEAEVAAAAGELAQADAALTAFRTIVGDEPPSWSIPNLARAHAAILQASGNPQAAIALLERSIDAPGIQPPDRARSLLALGSARRRAREYVRAREALVEALALFERLGTPPWIAAVERELGRIPGRRASPTEELTAAEMRIAERVAAGHSNKDVAADLVLSVKTIEVTLTRVYEKLGVRSRSELAARYRGATD